MEQCESALLSFQKRFAYQVTGHNERKRPRDSSMLAKKTNLLTSPTFGIFSIPKWNLSMIPQKVN